MLCRFAIEEALIDSDPTLGVRPIPSRSEGIHAWTEAEIEAFQTAYKVGTRERLALALLIHTAQRRSDVVLMGWQHAQGESISIVQAKTGARLLLPLHPDLAAMLEHLSRDNMTFLVTAQDKPFTPAGFGNRFGQAIRSAGLPKGCSSHGLRKAAARRLAEAGCSEKEIAAMTGHQTLKEVARYTRAADQHRLASQAMAQVERAQRETRLANLQERLAKGR